MNFWKKYQKNEKLRDNCLQNIILWLINGNFVQLQFWIGGYRDTGVSAPWTWKWTDGYEYDNLSPKGGRLQFGSNF